MRVLRARTFEPSCPHLRLRRDEATVITIENCQFSFQCPKDWFALERDPSNLKVRHCDTCNRNVHYCEIDDELMERVHAGDCVAIKRTPASGQPAVFLGMPSIEFQEGGTLTWD